MLNMLYSPMVSSTLENWGSLIAWKEVSLCVLMLLIIPCLWRERTIKVCHLFQDCQQSFPHWQLLVSFEREHPRQLQHHDCNLCTANIQNKVDEHSGRLGLDGCCVTQNIIPAFDDTAKSLGKWEVHWHGHLCSNSKHVFKRAVL